MLLLAARLARWRIQPVRAVLGALTGALIAQLVRAARLPRGAVMLLWLPTAMAVMAAAGGLRLSRSPMRPAALLLCAAGLLGGTVLSLYGATGSLALAYALGGCGALAAAACAVRAGRPARGAQTARALCRYRGCEAAFEAIVDSGNTLRDYLTHLPVIVLPEEAGRRLRVQAGALRPIFADTAGGRQMMRCFLPEETIVELDGERVRVRAAWALSPGLRSGAPALIPEALLEDGETEEPK